MPNFQVIKIFWKEIGCAFFAEVRARIRGNYPRIFTFFWIRKRKPTSIKPDQKILAKFSYPKNPGMEHFKLPKIIRSSPSLERERGGRGELREGTFAVSLSLPHPIAVFPAHSSLPRPHYLEQAICYGTLFSLLENVTINSKRTTNVGRGFFIAPFLHWFAFTTNVGKLLHVNTWMVDPAWSENPLTHILRTLKKISSLCLYC